MGTGRLWGKVAAITGGGSGIGQAAALIFAAEGARIAIVDRDRAAAEETARHLHAAGHDSLVLTGDVGEEATVHAHAEAIAARYGGLDVLLAAAGWSTGRSVADETLADWTAVLTTNLTGSFLWAKVAIQAMRQRGGGAIILVGSQLAFAGGRSNAAYLASKGAVVSLARSMAVDHAADGIRVNVLVPGAIDTPLLQRAFARSANPTEAMARSVARHPMGRLGTAQEMAKAALFLASDESSFTTGACLMADGGWLAG